MGETVFPIEEIEAPAIETPSIVSAAPASAPVATVDFPVPLQVYAASLRPQRVPFLRGGRPVIVRGRQVMTMSQGHPNEVWLRLLRIQHGRERHTPTEWAALIDQYREQPAHASDPRMT